MKVLNVFAHADDEVIFGWPYTFESCENHLLTISSHKDREVKHPLYSVASELGISDVRFLDIDTNFSLLPRRYVDIKFLDAVYIIKSELDIAISEVKPDFIFTHNPYGEYGHPDHRLIFDIVARTNYPIRYTDILEEGYCHLGGKPKYMDVFFKNKVGHRKLDYELFEKCREIYKSYNSWTWKDNVSRECNIYESNSR